MTSARSCSVFKPGKGILLPGTNFCGSVEISVEGLGVPDEVRLLDRRRIVVIRIGARLAADNAGKRRPDQRLAGLHRVAGLAFAEDLAAGGGIALRFRRRRRLAAGRDRCRTRMRHGRCARRLLRGWRGGVRLGGLRRRGGGGRRGVVLRGIVLRDFGRRQRCRFLLATVFQRAQQQDREDYADPDAEDVPACQESANSRATSGTKTARNCQCCRNRRQDMQERHTPRSISPPAQVPLTEARPNALELRRKGPESCLSAQSHSSWASV